MPEYCVTGGTGFIAAHLVKALLQRGHTVRTTVRDPGNLEKVGFLWELEGAKERLKMLKADLLVEGSFDAAVDGVVGVFHTASPVAPPPYGDNVQELLIDPAIKGTVNLLKSCVKARLWYAYAKTLAEKEAWKIADESGLDLVAVLPSFVVGPTLTPQPTSSIQMLLSIIKGSRGGIPNQIIGFVHIDDVISAHILAMEETKASGRLICSGPVAHWTEIVEMLRAKYPMYPYESQLLTIQQGDANPHSNDTSEIVALGLPAFKTIPEMFEDTITSFRDKGLLV